MINQLATLDVLAAEPAAPQQGAETAELWAETVTAVAWLLRAFGVLVERRGGGGEVGGGKGKERACAARWCVEDGGGPGCSGGGSVCVWRVRQAAFEALYRVVVDGNRVIWQGEAGQVLALGAADTAWSLMLSSAAAGRGSGGAEGGGEEEAGCSLLALLVQ